MPRIDLDGRGDRNCTHQFSYRFVEGIKFRYCNCGRFEREDFVGGESIWIRVEIKPETV